MEVYVNLKEKELKINEFTFPISCVVRNELNGWRKKDQVIYSIPDNKPVYPRPFPKGSWKIYGVEYTKDTIFAPVKIKTDAFQMLPVWELDENGHYKRKTEEITKDTCYWMHYSKDFKTTLGCIRLNSPNDALKIAELVETHLKYEEFIPLEVI